MHPSSFRPSHSRRSLSVAVGALVAVCMLVAGCGDESTATNGAAGPSGADSTTESTTAPSTDHSDEVAPVVVEFRPVISRSEPGSTVTSIGGPGVSGEDGSDPIEPVDPEGGLAATDSRTNVRYLLGPVAIDNSSIESATAGLSQAGNWQINPVLREGSEGIDKFNSAARKCFDATPQCPDLGDGRGQIAIVVDGEVVSAPTINVPSFEKDQISISGYFTAESAKALARAMTST